MADTEPTEPPSRHPTVGYGIQPNTGTYHFFRASPGVLGDDVQSTPLCGAENGATESGEWADRDLARWPGGNPAVWLDPDKVCKACLKNVRQHTGRPDKFPYHEFGTLPWEHSPEASHFVVWTKSDGRSGPLNKRLALARGREAAERVELLDVEVA